MGPIAVDQGRTQRIAWQGNIIRVVSLTRHLHRSILSGLLTCCM